MFNLINFGKDAKKKVRKMLARIKTENRDMIKSRARYPIPVETSSAPARTP
jgi:hypothetical protein